MPIGIVSDEDLQNELARLSPRTVRTVDAPTTPTILLPVLDNVQEGHLAPLGQEEQGQVIDAPSRGRNDGDNNVPDSLRQIIGEEAVINGRQAALGLAGMFGISPSSVSAYAAGATSTASYNNPTKSIIGHINKSRARATKKAGKVLSAALEAITQDKLDYADATDLSGIAKDMSVIIKNLEPTPEPNGVSTANTPQFVIFAPTFKDERSYESITVNE